jgi:hypothetical protein
MIDSLFQMETVRKLRNRNITSLSDVLDISSIYNQSIVMSGGNFWFLDMLDMFSRNTQIKALVIELDLRRTQIKDLRAICRFLKAFLESGETVRVATIIGTREQRELCEANSLASGVGYQEV